MKRGQNGTPNTLEPEMSGPPEKRRKTDGNPEPDDQFWDDNDDDFLTQDQLQNIDFIVASQVPAAESHQQDEGGSGSGGRGHRSSSNGQSGTTSSGNQGRSNPGSAAGAFAKSERQTPCKPSAAGQPHSHRTDSRRSQQGQDASRHGSNPGLAAHSEASAPLSTARSEGYHTLVTPPAHSGERTTHHGSDRSDVLQKELAKAKEECDRYKKEVQKLQESRYSKDGEIEMLRRNLAAREADLTKYKQHKVQQLQQEAQERTRKERDQENVIEGLRTQLQFKERELIELKNMYQRLERQSKPGTATSASEGGAHSQPLAASAQSPRASRHRGEPQSPLVKKGAFPTKHTFQGSPKPQRKISRTMDGEGRHASASPLPSTSTEAATTKAPHCKPPRRPQSVLGLANPRGHVSGPRLISHMLPIGGDCNSASDSISASPNLCAMAEQSGVLTLLETPLQAIDLSGVKLERDKNMLLSPAASNKWTMQSTPSTGSSTTSASCDLSPLVNREDYSLAQLSLSSLLNSSLQATQPDNLLTSDTASAISMLPLIEDYVSRYTDIMHATMDATVGTPVGSLSSVDTVTSSLESFRQGRASYVNKVENMALTALRILEVLVGRSSVVRDALVCDKDSGDVIVRNCTLFEERMEVGEMMPSTSKQQDDVLNQSAGQNESTHGSQDVRIIQECCLLRKVMKLANPLHFNNNVGNIQITCTALSILWQLVDSCPLQDVEKFQHLLIQDSLHNCLAGQLDVASADMFCLAHGALRVLTAMVRSENMVRNLCRIEVDDDCLLSVLYGACLQWSLELSREHQRQLCTQLIELLSTVTSLHKIGCSVLVESDCQCSTEVVKCVVIAMRECLQSYNQDADPETLCLLRKGTSLLHALSLRDHLFQNHHHRVEHQYVELICELGALFKCVDASLEEVNLIEEEQLWDFDQEYPDSGEESHENNNNGSSAMDVK